MPIAAELPVWPGDPTIEVAPVTRIGAGDVCNLSRLSMSIHSGTHVDAPWHFVDDGARLDEIPLDRWVGPCFVAELHDVTGCIDPVHLDGADIPPGTERLLLRTRNSRLWQSEFRTFTEDYVALSPASARWIVERGIRLVGIDYYSVDPFADESHKAHRILLGSAVLIVENLDLSGIAPGTYELFCFPLRLIGVDGAPARVVLLDPA
ncbi:MAG: cyclase family protein [Thermomicrobiales bacterium]